MFLPEESKIIPVAKELDLSGTVYTDSINMTNVVGPVTFMFNLNTLGGASSVLTVNSGATNAACTTAARFNYAFGGAALGTAAALSTVSCDVLSAWTSASTLTITYGSYSNFMLVVVVDPQDLDLANEYNWLTLKFTTTSSVTGTVSGFAVADIRSTGNRSDTVLA